MSFEIYQRSKPRVLGKQNNPNPCVNIGGNSRLTFNNTTTTIFKNTGVCKVIFLWDAEAKRIGIKPTANDDINGYKISYINNKGSACSGMGFLKHINVVLSKRTFIMQWDEQNQMFVIDTRKEREG